MLCYIYHYVLTSLVYSPLLWLAILAITNLSLCISKSHMILAWLFSTTLGGVLHFDLETSRHIWKRCSWYYASHLVMASCVCHTHDAMSWLLELFSLLISAFSHCCLNLARCGTPQPLLILCLELVPVLPLLVPLCCLSVQDFWMFGWLLNMYVFSYSAGPPGRGLKLEEHKHIT